MNENKPTIHYSIRCTNPTVEIDLPNKVYTSKEEAIQAAIDAEYWVVKRYLRLDDHDFMRKFAKKFWMDNFKIVQKAGPVIIPSKKKNLREEILRGIINV